MVQPPSRPRRLSYVAVVSVQYCLTSNGEWLIKMNWKGFGWNRSRHYSCYIPTAGWTYWITPRATYVTTSGVWTDITSRYSDSLRAGRSGDRIPVGGEIFCTRSDRLWGPLSLQYKVYRVFPGDNVVGAWRLPPNPSSAEVKERIELYVYSPLWAFVACYRVTFTFNFTSPVIQIKSTLTRFTP